MSKQPLRGGLDPVDDPLSHPGKRQQLPMIDSQQRRQIVSRQAIKDFMATQRKKRLQGPPKSDPQ